MFFKLKLLIFTILLNQILNISISHNTEQEIKILSPYHSINNFFYSFTDHLNDFGGNKALQTNAYSFPKPQSFSILMNFRYDGQQWIQLMDQIHGIVWSDAGYCGHGQMYDPIAKICRRYSIKCEILCMIDGRPRF
jgi:hypothetical protein